MNSSSPKKERERESMKHYQFICHFFITVVTVLSTREETSWLRNVCILE